MTAEIYRIVRDNGGSSHPEMEDWDVYYNGEYIGSAPDRTSAEQLVQQHMKAEAEKIK